MKSLALVLMLISFSLPAFASGQVLYPQVSCENGNLVIGSGAGFFAADIKAQGVIDYFLKQAAEREANTFWVISGEGSDRVLTITFGSRDTRSGEYGERTAMADHTETLPDGAVMVAVAGFHERNNGRYSYRDSFPVANWVFRNCVKVGR